MKNEKAVDPVWPNAGVEAWYRKQLTDLIDAMSADMVASVTAAWKENPPSIGFGQDADPSVLIQKALDKWGGLWVKKFDTLSATLSAAFATRAFATTQNAMKASFKKAGFAVNFKPTRKSIQAYKAVVATNVGLIKSIPPQYLDKVQGKVWASVREGSTLHKLSVDLRQTYGVTVRRAALIARDQNAKAKATIENVRRLEAGITEARWIHSSAGKEPRPLHVKWGAERKLYKLSEGMYDDVEGEYVYPGQLINCRCASKAIIPGF